MALESAETCKVHATRETGRMINNTASAVKSMMKVPNTRVSTTWVSKKAKVSTLTRMGLPTKEAGIKTRWMDMAHSWGWMGENTMGSCPKTACMATASTYMQTV